jgi:hypothetical protein
MGNKRPRVFTANRETGVTSQLAVTQRRDVIVFRHEKNNICQLPTSAQKFGTHRAPCFVLYTKRSRGTLRVLIDYIPLEAFTS